MVNLPGKEAYYSHYPLVGGSLPAFWRGSGKEAEGRMKWDEHDSLFYPEYFIKDHLGNVRTVLTTDPNYVFITRQSIYYQLTDKYFDML